MRVIEDVLLFACVFIALVIAWTGILRPWMPRGGDLVIVLAWAVPVFAWILALVRTEEESDYPVLRRSRSGRIHLRRLK